MSKGKKRFCSEDEKREICGQARVDDASVAQVARRYAMNANLIHKWMCDPRFEPVADGREVIVEASFLPVEVTGSGVLVDEAAPDHAPSALYATRVDLTLSDGRRVLIEGPTALGAVVGLVEGLAL
ncbi:MAG: transposase [Tateyamaria sp.]|nr:transposase [Tateyamaria sp.]